MKSASTFGAGLAAGLIAVLASPSARADDATAARAQTLFDQGLAAAREGQFAKACPLFRASQDVEARTGTLLNLGTCYERNWQTASAWVAYREAEASAAREGRPELEAQAKQKWKLLEPRLVKLTVHVDAAAKAQGVTVTRDGVTLADAELDVAVPVDPGEHLVAAQAAGRAAWQEQVMISKTSRELRVPALAVASVSWWTTGRKVGVPVAAVGVGSVIVGGVLALVANSKYQTAQGTCRVDGVADCNPGSRDEEHSARSLANAATVPLIVGGVLAASGVALVVFAHPKRSPTRGSCSPRAPAVTSLGMNLAPGWLGLSGRFE